MYCAFMYVMWGIAADKDERARKTEIGIYPNSIVLSVLPIPPHHPLTQEPRRR